MGKGAKSGLNRMLKRSSKPLVKKGKRPAGPVVKFGKGSRGAKKGLSDS